jgi:hypothetical protein
MNTVVSPLITDILSLRLGPALSAALDAEAAELTRSTGVAITRSDVARKALRGAMAHRLSLDEPSAQRPKSEPPPAGGRAKRARGVKETPSLKASPAKRGARRSNGAA